MFASFSGKSVTSHLSSSEASRMSWFLRMINFTGSKQLNHAERASDLSLLKSLNPGTKVVSSSSCLIGKISQNSIGQFSNSPIVISAIVNASPLTASGRG